MAIRVGLLDRIRRPRPAPEAKPKPEAAAKPKPAARPQPAAKPGTRPAAKPNPKRTSKPRPRPRPRGRKPPPPVLQRRTLGSTLARAAVMAAAIVCMVAFAVA